MRNDVPYDVMRDFAPVTLVVRNTTMIVVERRLAANSIKDLAAAAKAKPGELDIRLDRRRRNTHLASNSFRTRPGSSSSRAISRRRPCPDRPLGGQVQVFAADAPVLMPQIRGGKIKALGAASGQAQSDAARCRTLAEQGYPDTTIDNWYGLLAPSKTPPAVIAKLHDAFIKAINDPAVKEKLIQSGAIPVAGQFRGDSANSSRRSSTAGARWCARRASRTRADAQRLGRYSPVRRIAAQRRHAARVRDRSPAPDLSGRARRSPAAIPC
jgi:tripartite-type tricarboxylate transporter receptor subunit TctC